jgi:hypothetical protein
MGQFFRILLTSPRLTVSVCLLIIGGVSGALKHREAEAKSTNPWSNSDQVASSSSDDDAGGWGKSTKPASRTAPSKADAEPVKVWQNEDGVIFEEEDVKALDRSEYE